MVWIFAQQNKNILPRSFLASVKGLVT